MLTLQNPFSKRFDNIFCVERKITKNKVIEVEVLKTPVIVCFTFELSMRRNYTGFFLNLGLIGYEVMVSLYDTRNHTYTQSEE